MTTRCHIVVSVTEIAESVRAVRLQPLEGPRQVVRPGQFVPLGPAGRPRRAYSLLTLGVPDPAVELWVEVHAHGVVGPWLAGLGPGERIELPPSVGGFGPRPTADRGARAVLIGEHTGIVPLLGIAAALRGDGRDVRVGAAVLDPRFDVSTEASVRGAAAGVGVERIPGALDGTLSWLRPTLDASTDLYVAGGGAFLAAIWALLPGCGLSPARVRQEKFW